MPYCQLLYHFVWATKDRAPRLTAETEPLLHRLLRVKAVQLGAHVYALNGIEDHVHLIAAVPPSLAISRFVGQVKATAATQFNKSGQDELPFFWQQEYGAFTFDLPRLPYHVKYVREQKEHHRRGSVKALLERCAPPDEESPASG